MLSVRLACVRVSFGMIAWLAVFYFRPSNIGNPMVFYVTKNLTLAEKRLPARERHLRQQELRARWDLLSSEAKEQWAVVCHVYACMYVTVCMYVVHACLSVCCACPLVTLARLLRSPVCSFVRVQTLQSPLARLLLFVGLPAWRLNQCILRI